MRKMALSFLALVLFLSMAFAWLSLSKTGKRITAFYGPRINSDYRIPSPELAKIQSKAAAAKAFARQNHFDTSLCFLIDMSLAANHNRFFVYDLKKDSIQHAGLVAHGNCNQYWLEGRKYGNEMGCGCTSLGRYRVGAPYYGRFGLAFKLYGLDKTNSNAFNRFVVLHAHDCMPDREVAQAVCQSNGCPMVSPNFLKLLQPMIQISGHPILLWIFE